MRIEVHGHVEPAGSKQSFYVPKLKRAVTTDANKKAKDWKKEVQKQARAQVPHKLSGAVAVVCYIKRLRPKSHYNSKGQLKPNAPKYPAVKPDASKLFRGTEDALTGIAWEDDAQIVHQLVSKVYSETEGALIYIEAAD